MGRHILLIGCASHIKEELASLGGHGAWLWQAVAGLSDPALQEALTAADLIVLHENAVLRDFSLACQHLRKLTSRPIIAIIQAPSDVRIAEILEAGADDVVGTQTSIRELWARIRAQLRRDQEYAASPQSALNLGIIQIDNARHEVYLRGQPVMLTPREFELLEYLARYAGRPVRRDVLLQRIWGYTEEMPTRTLDVHVGRLRQKIERDPSHPELIVTVPGFGYKLCCPPE